MANLSETIVRLLNLAPAIMHELGAEQPDHHPDPPVIQAARKLLSDGTMCLVDGQLLDKFSAQAIVQAYDSLPEDQRTAFSGLDLASMVRRAWSIVLNQ